MSQEIAAENDWMKKSKEFFWMRVDDGKFEEGDLVWIQDKSGPSTTVGYVVLKDNWTFMLNHRPGVYNAIDWYVAVLMEKD